MDYNEINDELKEKAKACTTPEELLELAQKEGIRLSDEDLTGIAGGEDTWHQDCNSKIYGDERDDIDETAVNEAFMTGELRGDGLD